MDWDDLRIFLAVARRGSVRAAADALDVNHSTVSRRIRAFEKKLGVRLFERLPTGYVTTPSGEDMLQAALRLERDILALERQVLGRDTQLTGDLRVTMPDVLATKLLMPDLTSFAQTYPGIDLEVIVSDENFNLTKREADVAIRLTNDPPEHLVGRRLFTHSIAVYATVNYLAQHEPGHVPSSLEWIGWGDVGRDPKWIQATPFPSVPVRHRLNNVLLQLEAVKSGLGISILPCFVGDQEPSLRRLPPGIPKPSRAIWLLTHADLRTTARVRSFIDFMARAIKAHQQLLEGKCPHQADTDEQEVTLPGGGEGS